MALRPLNQSCVIRKVIIMKQKLAIGVIILLIVLVGLLLIFNGTAGTKTVFFEETDYPVTVVTKKSGMTVTVKAKADQDVPWTVYVTDSDIAEINLKGNKKPNSEKYKVKALSEGITYIHLEKVQQAYGYEAVLVSMDIPINVSAEGKKLTLSLMEGETFFLGTGNFVANDSEFPFILRRNGAAADIVFINGLGDWTIDTMDAPVRYEITEPEEGEAIVRLFYSEGIKEAKENASGENGDGAEETPEPEEELTEEEAEQRFLEESYGTPPEGFTYDDARPVLSLADVMSPSFVYFDEEGNNIADQVREYVLYGTMPEGVSEEVRAAFEGAKTQAEGETGETVSEESSETEVQNTEETAETTEEATEETAEEAVEETAEEATDEATEESAEETDFSDFDPDNFTLPDDVILTQISFHSDSLNQTVYINIVIDTMGNLYLSKGEAPN